MVGFTRPLEKDGASLSRARPFAASHLIGDGGAAQICGSSTTPAAPRPSRAAWRATSTRAVRRRSGLRICDLRLVLVATSTLPTLLPTARWMVVTRRAWTRWRMARRRLISRTRQEGRQEGRTRGPSTTRPSRSPSRVPSSSISGSLGSCMRPEVRPSSPNSPRNLTTRWMYRGARDHVPTSDQGPAPVFGRCVCASLCPGAFPGRAADWEGHWACFWVVCYAGYVQVHTDRLVVF